MEYFVIEEDESKEWESAGDEEPAVVDVIPSDFIASSFSHSYSPDILGVIPEIRHLKADLVLNGSV